MKNTTILTSLLAVSSLMAFAGCGDNNNTTPDAAVKKDAKPIDAPVGPPAPPALGAQIDRLGRPAINTALNRSFEPPATAGHGAAKDAYNTDSNKSGWGAANLAEFTKNLGVLDSLDGACGNAPGYSSPVATTSYDGEEALLADDQLYVDTTQGTCALFLGVELSVLLGLPPSARGCGGRAPSYDVMDFSYSALAAGGQGFVISGGTFTPKVQDGVAAHTGGNATSDTAFPFLAAPH
jgi:hypothetical protein